MDQAKSVNVIGIGFRISVSSLPTYRADASRVIEPSHVSAVTPSRRQNCKVLDCGPHLRIFLHTYQSLVDSNSRFFQCNAEGLS